jgi:hypothetical protein
MPLIQSKSAAAAASILSRVQHLAGNYNAAATHLNAIVRDLLALDDADLAAFCNEQGPAGLNELTTLHAEHGAAISELSAAAAAMLFDSGIMWPASVVDVRPLGDKLAEQGREMTFADGVFAVSQFPQSEPPPAPEPEPEPLTP